MNINRRVLIIDDNRAIHDDFRKILAPAPRSAGVFEALEAEIFSDGEPEPATASTEMFEVHSAYQGQQGYVLTKEAQDSGKPFAMAFVDVRMPPGWDGIETISHLWEASPKLQAVICTAYSDYSWEDIVEQLGNEECLMMLRKPLDPVEIHALACRLTEKWSKASAT